MSTSKKANLFPKRVYIIPVKKLGARWKRLMNQLGQQRRLRHAQGQDVLDNDGFPILDGDNKRFMTGSESTAKLARRVLGVAPMMATLSPGCCQNPREVLGFSFLNMWRFGMSHLTLVEYIAQRAGEKTTFVYGFPLASLVGLSQREIMSQHRLQMSRVANRSDLMQKDGTPVYDPESKMLLTGSDASANILRRLIGIEPQYVKYQQ